ncbi:DNA glycosylase [Microstroma glucosiphilum]|uniref:Adenine DNA glycosylase n=1 Tax=Pseudomicrostroma glucosiphilum TaxID=1684307 RepID=A0A316UFD4_9BASI|nr:DNA glycosylase [Pseudomicrostroma glucosiphilum]PWN22603.1 DNA glycosylase [Pseudomicrostroma glucosiphilum]
MPSPSRPKPNTSAKGAPSSSPALMAASSVGPSHWPVMTAVPPERHHSPRYHEPLLLHPQSHRERKAAGASLDPSDLLGQDLLLWYANVADTRGMPWRQKWVSPNEEQYVATTAGRANLRELLERRAYEVWISEIMLQQTRVATVISYWQSWTSRWPTIQALAAASPDDVLSAWKGLGYYSRATRIHQAAQAIVADPELKGLLPATAQDLEKKVAGVGRYTAGAISSIVFGRAEAILDGNVSRVLSRQLALYANPKSKMTTDLLWDAAQKLVEGVAGFSKSDDERAVSEVPGLWNQALMELGSTVCTPIPNCGGCPIRSTCRAYAEGEQVAVDRGLLSTADVVNSLLAARPDERHTEDLEDLCQLCEPFSAYAGQEEQDVVKVQDTKEGPKTAANGKRKKDTAGVGTSAKKARAQQSSLLVHFKKRSHDTTQDDAVRPEKDTHKIEPRLAGSATALTPRAPSREALEVIQTHVKRFPFKVRKAQVREEKCIVCIIETRSSAKASRYLLEQRPDKGLLASLWEFPTLTLSLPDSHHDDDDENHLSTARDPPASHTTQATKFVQRLLKLPQAGRAEHSGPLGTLTHVFSHMKLEMNVHHFSVSGDEDEGRIEAALVSKAKRKWCTAEEVEAASIGTGMKRCWELLSTRDTSAVRGKSGPQVKDRKMKRK